MTSNLFPWTVHKKLAGTRVVSVDRTLAGDDELVPSRGADHDGSPPAHRRFALGGPQRVASLLVERGDERPALLILVEDHASPVQDGRARAPVVVAESADPAMPENLPVEIERRETLTAERREDSSSVGHRGGGGVAVLLVDVLDGVGLDRRLPEKFSVGTAVREER